MASPLAHACIRAAGKELLKERVNMLSSSDRYTFTTVHVPLSYSLVTMHQLPATKYVCAGKSWYDIMGEFECVEDCGLLRETPSDTRLHWASTWNRLFRSGNSLYWTEFLSNSTCIAVAAGNGTTIYMWGDSLQCLVYLCRWDTSMGWLIDRCNSGFEIKYWMNTRQFDHIPENTLLHITCDFGIDLSSDLKLKVTQVLQKWRWIGSFNSVLNSSPLMLHVDMCMYVRLRIWYNILSGARLSRIIIIWMRIEQKYASNVR